MTLIMKRNRVAQVAQSNQSLLEVCPSLSAEAESHALEHRAAKCVWVLHNPEDWLPGKINCVAKRLKKIQQVFGRLNTAKPFLEVFKINSFDRMRLKCFRSSAQRGELMALDVQFQKRDFR